MILLTLNDGHLAEPVQQSMLLLVEDQNDSKNIFCPIVPTNS